MSVDLTNKPSYEAVTVIQSIEFLWPKVTWVIPTAAAEVEVGAGAADVPATAKEAFGGKLNDV